MNQIKIDKQKKKDIVFWTGLFFGFLFLLWKSKYGTGAYDEPFYLTMPHRFANGEGMFTEEWNFGQLSAFLMLPVMKIYLMLMGGTEGIILHFRYIYIGFQLLCTVAVYGKLRKKELAWAAAWLFLLFCPYDIMAVSYNTIGIAFMTLTGILLTGAGEKDKKSWFICGILFAAAVLCNPFLVLMYVLYTVLVLGLKWYNRKEKKQPDAGILQRLKKDTNLGLTAWLMITAGAAVLAVLFIIAVLLGSSISELLENIPLLMNDPEHTSRSIFMIIKVYLTSFWSVYGWFIPVWAVLLVMSYFFRKDSVKRRISFALLSFSTILSILSFIPTIQNSYNFIMVPVAVCGFGAYIMTEEKDSRTFWFMYLFGGIYTFIANYASNQGMHAISMAMIPMDVAAVLFIGQFAAQEQKNDGDAGAKREKRQNAEAVGKQERKKKPGSEWVVTASVILLFVTQLGMQVYTKAVHAFWEEPVQQLDTVVTQGPLKGTVTTKEKAEEYEEKLEDIKLHLKKEGPVLFATKDTWCYLYADTEYGTFSSYLSGGLQQSAERWEMYFGANPEKLPYYIYVPKESGSEWEDTIYEDGENYGYRVEESEKAYHLYKE